MNFKVSSTAQGHLGIGQRRDGGGETRERGMREEMVRTERERERERGKGGKRKGFGKRVRVRRGQERHRRWERGDRREREAGWRTRAEE